MRPRFFPIAPFLLGACSGGNFTGGTRQIAAPAPAATIAPNFADSKTSVSRNPDSPSPLPSAAEVKALREKCAQAPANAMRTMEQSMQFAERQICRFGSTPNLERKQGFVQAAETSPAILNLPAGDICNIRIDSLAQAALHYDDFLVLTIDSRIVFISNKSIASYLDAPEQGILTWDPSRVLGRRIADFEAAPYCLGKGSACMLPGHDQQGPVALHLGSSEIAPIAKAIAGRESVPVNLIATGDNDDTDCSHTALSVSVKIDYLP